MNPRSAAAPRPRQPRSAGAGLPCSRSSSCWRWRRKASGRAATLEREAEHTAQLSVEVVHPQKSDAALDLVLPGNVQAYLDTPIYARTNGYLKKWYADIGSHVKAGQLLAEIDTPEVDDQLRAARADVTNAQANYELAKTTADRWTDMLKNKSVSKQETDEKVGDML